MTLVRRTLKQGFLKALPEHLIGDMAYDSDGLDADLAADGIEMNAPHNPTRKIHDGRALRRYGNRWRIERFFARFQHARCAVTCRKWH